MRGFFPLGALAFVLCAAQITTLNAAEEGSSNPKRIVSVNLCTDELLLQFVGPERVAALTKFSADPEISTVAFQARGIKKIQGGIEDVQACGPDLLVGGRFSHQETLRFFDRAGIPVLTFGVPKNFEDIYEDIRRLAAGVGESAKGEKMIRDMQEELLKLRPASGIKKRAVFFQSDNYVPGVGTFENALMEAAGLRNIAFELGIKDYGRMGLEELIQARPDVIIFSSEQTKTRTVRGEVLSHPAIKKALPEVKIVTLSTLYLNCGSPVSVEAVRILVKETSP